MADKPAGTPPNFNQIGAGTPPANQGSELLSGLQNIHDEVRQQGEAIKSATELTKTLVGVTSDWQTKLKGIVQYTEDYEDSFKRLITLGKEFGITLGKAKTYKELKKNLEDLNKTQKHLMSEGFFDKHTQRDLQSTIDYTSKAIKRMDDYLAQTGKTLEEAIDPDIMAELGQNTRMATLSIEKMAKVFNSIHLKPLTKQAMQFNEAFGRSGLLEKYAKYAQISTRLEKMKTTSQGESKIGLKVHADSLDGRTKSIARAAGLFGGQRDKRLKTLKPEYFKDVSRELTQKGGGGGFVDRYLAQRALTQAASVGTDGKPTFLHRAMEAGKGSVTQGIKTLGFQGTAGFMGEQVAGVARMAPVLAIVELLQKFIDANAKANKDIADNLGEAGIFGGKQSGVSSLFNVRKSLGSENMGFNWTGETFQKNLKIAQAIKEGGINLPELATGGRPGETSGTGMIKQVAYHGAKLAGYMDEGAAAKEIVGVMQQYHQSFEGVKSFFEHINRDTATAGITTTKYIGIIDDLNKQFDRMGQSLQSTVNIMHVLGKSGVMASEDVREALNTLTNAGRTRGFEMQAFLGMQEAQAGGTGKRLKYQEANVKDASEQAQRALAVPSIGMALSSLKSRDDIYAAMNQVQDSKGSPGEKQSAYNALTQLDQEMGRLEAQKKINSLANEGRFGDAGLAQASVNSSLGYNLTGKTMETFRGVKTALRQANGGQGYSMHEFLSGAGSTDPALKQLHELLGNDPEVAQQLRRVLAAQGRATMQAAGAGTLGDSSYKRLTDLASSMGMGMEGKTARQKIQNLNADQKNRLAGALSTSGGTIDDILDSEHNLNGLAEKLVSQGEKDSQKNKAEQVATATRPLADIFADAFDNLFNTISAPLGNIYDFLTRKFGSAVDQGQIDRVRKEYSSGDFDKLSQHVDELREAAKENLKDVSDKLADNSGLKTSDPTTYAKLQTEQKAALNRFSNLDTVFQDLMNARRNATSERGASTEQEVIRDDNVWKNAPIMAAAVEKMLAAATSDAQVQGQVSDKVKSIQGSAQKEASDSSSPPLVMNHSVTNLTVEHVQSQAPSVGPHTAPGEGASALGTRGRVKDNN